MGWLSTYVDALDVKTGGVGAAGVVILVSWRMVWLGGVARLPSFLTGIVDAVGDEGREKSGAGDVFAIQLEECDWSLVDESSSL